jgi:hypothetical protein
MFSGKERTSQTLAPNRLLANELRQIAKLPLASLWRELNRAGFPGGGRFILTSLAESPCSPGWRTSKSAGKVSMDGVILV